MGAEFCVPVVEVPRVGEVFVPKEGDLTSGITEALKEARVLELAGNHEFLILPPSTPHHPQLEKHWIWWVNKVPVKKHFLRLGDEVQVTPWTDHSWQKLLDDREFLKVADEKFSALQNNNGNLRVYFVFGYAHEEDIAKAVGLSVFPRSSQSQYPGHVHVTEGVEPECADWQSMGANQSRQLAMFLNLAGELAIKEYNRLLINFGTRINFNQIIRPVKTKNNYAISRTFFGFSSFEEALGAVLELNKQLLESWLKVAVAIAKNNIVLAGEHVRVMQACVPGFSAMRPSIYDRKLMNLADGITWVVAPFAIPLPQTLLGGVLLNRGIIT